MSSVEKDGPAAKAGVRPGDVIVKFNDQDIATSSDLPLLVSSAKPGSQATLEILAGDLASISTSRSTGWVRPRLHLRSRRGHRRPPGFGGASLDSGGEE